MGATQVHFVKDADRVKFANRHPNFIRRLLLSSV